jgi:aminobenzoyl-glutamate utilization protein B
MSQGSGLSVALIEEVETSLNSHAARFIELSDAVWGFAEMGFAEKRSSAAQIDALRREGFQIKSAIGGLPTAFIAERGAGRPIIGVLGEFDALAGMSQVAGADRPEALDPGKPGHGCGHNLLGTGAALAAVIAAEVLGRNGLKGTVRYYACPAEEGGGGKAFMARAGAFDDLDAAFTWHPASHTSAHANSTNAFLQMKVQFDGRASHAAISPEKGRSALDAAELMNVGVNYLREHMSGEERIHYAYRSAGGTAANVVQSSVELAYIVRSPTIERLQSLTARVKKVAEGAAMMTETSVDFQIESGMSPFRPNPALTQLMYQQLLTFGAPKFDDDDMREAGRFVDKEGLLRQNAALDTDVTPLAVRASPSLGSSDVGDVSVVVPTAQVWVAAFARDTAFHSWQLVSQGKLPAAHKGMLHAAKVMAASVIEAATQPQVLKKAKDDHRQYFNGEVYQCPIPADVLPPLPAE